RKEGKKKVKWREAKRSRSRWLRLLPRRPVAGVAAENLLASRPGKPRAKKLPHQRRKRQRRKPLKRNPHAKQPRENLLGKKQQAGERNPRAGAAKLWRTLSCVQAPSRGSPPRLFLQICLRVRRRRFGLGTRLTPVRTSPNMLSTPRLSAL